LSRILFRKNLKHAIHGLKVITIMMNLYDEEEVMKIYIESEKNDLRCEMAMNMINDGELTLETIARYSGLPIKDVKELQSKMLQPVV
jgi:predicted HTH domain antitoxin